MAETREIKLRIVLSDIDQPLTVEEKLKIIKELEGTQISKVLRERQALAKIKAEMKPEIQWDIDG